MKREFIYNDKETMKEQLRCFSISYIDGIENEESLDTINELAQSLYYAEREKNKKSAKNELTEEDYRTMFRNRIVFYISKTKNLDHLKLIMGFTRNFYDRENK